MEEQLAKHLDEIVEALKKGIEFTSEQAPLFIQEYLAYAAYFHWIMIGCMLVLFAGLLVGVHGAHEKMKKQNRWDDWEVAVGMFTIISALPLGIAVANAISLVKLYVAPRVYLIEKISELI